MKDYLIEFFDEFSYEKSDADFLLSVYDKIIQNFEANNFWHSALTLYENDINCDFKAILNSADNISEKISIHKYTTELLVCICLTKQLKSEYVARNIDLDIFHNSVLDLRYKLDECKLVKGIVGSFVADWFYGWFNMTRFALGRLQFDMSTLGTEYKGLSADRFALAVHIPRSGEPLTADACDSSFKLAKKIFEDKFLGNYVFTCNSWLLYPENNLILSESSNIYKFMKRFDIIDFGDSETNGDLWRIFDTDEKELKFLPRNTTLQKAYAEHLENGGKMGWGFGIILM